MATERDLLITILWLFFGDESRNVQTARLNLNFANGTESELRESKVDGLRSRGGKNSRKMHLALLFVSFYARSARPKDKPKGKDWQRWEMVKWQ